MAHVSARFQKILIADKYSLEYSNAAECLKHFGGFVNPPRNSGKDSVYDAERRETGSSRFSAAGDGSPNHPARFLSFPLDSSRSA